jgi:hypothetical protein
MRVKFKYLTKKYLTGVSDAEQELLVFSLSCARSQITTRLQAGHGDRDDQILQVPDTVHLSDRERLAR